jgi:hypothetical protein
MLLRALELKGHPSEKLLDIKMTVCRGAGAFQIVMHTKIMF